MGNCPTMKEHILKTCSMEDHTVIDSTAWNVQKKYICRQCGLGAPGAVNPDWKSMKDLIQGMKLVIAPAPKNTTKVSGLKWINFMVCTICIIKVCLSIRIECRVLEVLLDKHCTTELHPQPSSLKNPTVNHYSSIKLWRLTTGRTELSLNVDLEWNIFYSSSK